MSTGLPPTVLPPPPSSAAPHRTAGPGLEEARGLGSVLARPLERGGLLAAACAAAVVALVTGDGTGVPTALALAALVAGGAAAAHAERPLDRVERAVALVALVAVAQWGLSDATPVLVATSLLVVPVTGLLLAGPRSGREMVRTSVAAPLLGLLSVVALWRGAGSVAGAGAARRLLVPLGGSLAVLVVVGSLLASADPVVGRVLAVLVPDLDEGLVGRGLVGLVAALCVVVVGLARRTARRPAAAGGVGGHGPDLPRAWWLAPVAVLDALLLLYLAVQARQLFGGAGHVAEVDGLTFAGYARQGVFQLLAVAVVVLLVVGTTVHAARRQDLAVRDVALGVAVAATAVVLASASHRLWVYEQAYGSTRLRLGAAACLLWVALALAVVVVGRLRPRVGREAVRACVALAVVVACGFVLVRPDAVVARRNLERAAATGQLDVALLGGLSADARPALRGAEVLRRDSLLLRAARADGTDVARLGCPGRRDDGSWNLAAARARTRLGCGAS